MTARACAVVALSIAAALSACGAPRPVSVDFSEKARDYRSRDYHDIYQRWTRHGLARRDVDSALEAWATYKSWDFREAYIEHYAEIYSLSDADKGALRSAQMEAFHAAYEFHVTAQSTNYLWNDLERRNSPWRVSLVDGLGHELASERVKLEKLPEPYEIEFFPAKDLFTRSYAIRFVKPVVADGKDAGKDIGKDAGKDPSIDLARDADFVGAATGSLMLRIASPVGRIELTWQAN